MKSIGIAGGNFRTIVVVLFGLFAPVNVLAQSASAAWALSSTSLLSVTSTGNVVGGNEIIGAGPTPSMVVFDYTSNGQRLWKGTSGWSQESAQEDTRFIQFDVTPMSGNSLTVTSVSFNYGAAGVNGLIVSNVYYSTNGWNSRTQLNTSGLLSYPASSMLSFSANVSVAVAGGSTFSIRIYPYAIQNSSPMSPTFAVHNNVVINGTTASTRGSICGIKFNDLDGDGVQDAGELGLPNWVIKLSYNLAIGPITVYDTTDANGSFCFTGLQSGGTYTVSEISQSGWEQTYPSGAGTYTIALGAGQNIDTLKFGNKRLSTLGSICGSKFNDLNGNGVKDSRGAGEPGLAGWRIQLSYNLATGPVTLTTTTDSLGNFCFNNLAAGTYTVSEVSQTNWLQTAPSSPGTYTISLKEGENVNNIVFGNTNDPCILGLTIWSPVDSGMNGKVRALAVIGGELYAGGAFTVAGGTTANYVAKWDGVQWSALGSGMSREVRSLAVMGGELYAGGDFTVAGGVTVNGIAKWNGSSWSSLGSGMNGTVYALAVIGNELYAGGLLSTAGGVTVNGIAKWNGSSWSSLGAGVNNAVWSLAAIGTDLYAGGAFTTAGGVSAVNIAKWNGTTWSSVGSGINDDVFALAAMGGELYAGGEFTGAGGVLANGIAKWNGLSWSSLGGGTNLDVRAMAVYGTNLYAGGSFTTAGGTSANRVAQWDGTSWTPLGSGINSTDVLALAVMGRGLYAGGEFTTAGDVSAKNVAKYSCLDTTTAILGSLCGTKFNDLNGNGVQDEGEPRLPNWTINLTGTMTLTATTDEKGNYCFGNLKAGTYTIAESSQTGWRQTYPSGSGTHTVTLGAGENRDGINFGNMQVSIIGCSTNLLNISTGWNHNSSTTYNPGTDQDVFWTLVQGPTTNGPVNLNGPAWVIQKGHTSWADALSGSQWISAFQVSSSNLENVGPLDTPYVFQRSLCVADTTNLTFDLNVLVDNQVVIQFVDANGNLISQIGALSTTSTANFTSPTNFFQTIPNVMPGTYYIRLRLRNDDNSTAMGLNVQGTVAGGFSSLIGTLCCDTTGSTITGYKFHDLDNDGVKDSSEAALQGWTITLEGNGISQSSTTDANGSYLFTGIPAGTYTLTETPQNGWVAGPTGAQQTITIGTNQSINNVNFGNVRAVGSVCDSLSATAARITPGDCQWSLNLNQPTSVSGISSIRIRCLSPNQFATGTGLGANFQNWFTTGSNTYTPPNGIVPGGSLNNFFTMNLSSVTSPQIIVVDWLDVAGGAVCSDTLELDCLVSCVSVISDTVVCVGSSYNFLYSFINNATYGISSIEYTLQSPSTVTISPLAALVSPTVASGLSSGIQNITLSGAVPGDTVRIQAKFMSPDGCCWCYEILRVIIPSCGSVCDSVSVQAQGSPTDCCYSISLLNSSSSVFSNLEFELLSGGMFSTATTAVSGWGFTNISPNNLINLVKLPIAQGIGNGAFNDVLNLCVRQYSSPMQVIEVRWMKNGQVVCRDTLRFQCITPPPPTNNCSQTFDDSLMCLPNGTLQYNFRIRNNSNLVSSGFGIYPTTPGVSFTQTNFPGVSIMPGQVSPIQSVIITGLGGGQNLCFQTTIYTTVQSDGTIYNYCCHSDTMCVATPVCRAQLGSICGVKFNDINGDSLRQSTEPGLAGWIISLTYNLATGPVTLTDTTDANGQYCFTKLSAGIYTISETPQSGWLQTVPPAPGTYTITLAAGQDVDSINFGNKYTVLGCVQPPPGMVAWWPLDETLGATIVSDIVGTNNGSPQPGPIGTMGSSVGGPIPGSTLSFLNPKFKVVGSLYFYAGVNKKYVKVPDNPTLNFGTGDLTIDAWVYPVVAGPTLVQPIVDKSQPSALFGCVGYRLFILNGQLNFVVMDGINISVTVVPISYSQWQHVVAVRKGGTPNTIQLYVNGALVTTAMPQVNNISNTTDLLIGSIASPSGGTACGVPAQFNFGEIAIDELEIFNRALTPGEAYSLWYADSLGKCKPTTTDVQENQHIPEKIELLQSYPNPFNPTAKIRFRVAKSGYVSLKVFDLMGKEVAVLVSQEMQPGTYERTFDAQGLTSGVYFYRLQAGNLIETKKLILLR